MAAPADVADAVEMVLDGLGYLAALDPTTLTAEAQARCLQALEQGGAISTAARARILAAFTAGRGYCDDADYSPTSWLIHRTRITKGQARGHVRWSRRTLTHPTVVAALAEGIVLSESMALIICGWTDKLPAGCRQAADEILIAAARAGARQEDLAALAAEIYARSVPESGDDPEPAFEDRKVRVETTFQGAGVLSGDLTPQCAAVVQAVLDALSAPRGAEDTRTREQRYHDGLEDAMRRLVAAGLLPERAGQPVKLWGHVSLAELRALDDGSVLQQEWTGEMAIRWAVHRAAASQSGSDGAAWLDGKAAAAAACDATIVPVVTGQIDPAALDDLVDLCLQFAGHGRHCGPAPAGNARPATRTRPRTRPAARTRPRTRPAGVTPVRLVRGRRPRRPWRCSAMRSSARRSTWSPARAGWPVSCGPGCWAPASPAPACRWTSGTARRSRPRSAGR